MAKIYLVRHAESIANTRGIYQGQTYDTGLSPLGRKQARVLASTLADEAVDAIIASPLKRTRYTAQTVARKKHIRVQLEPRLLETNHGQWEGLQKHTIAKKWPEAYQLWFRSPSKVAFPDGEKFVDTQARVMKWWKKFAKTRENTLVVTHDNIIRIILADVLGMRLDYIWRLYLVPTGITIIRVDEDIQIVTLNDMRHVGKVNLAKHAF